jgi:HK97 family phage major capsid protein
MNEEIKKALEELRALVGKNVDAVARIAAIEEAATKRDADAKAIRTEIEALRADLAKRENEIKELRQQGRVQSMQREGVTSKRRGLELMGMQIRAALSKRFAIPIPEAFASEAEQVRAFQARATMSADGGAGGNLTIPTVTASDLIDSLEEVSTLLSLADFRPGLPGKMDMPVLTGRPALLHKRATVDTNMTQSDASVSNVSFDPDEGYIFMPVDNRWIQMSAIGLGQIGFPLIQEGIISGIVNDLLNADGTASFNSITGALKVSDAAYLYVMPSGKKSIADLAPAHIAAAKAKALKRARGPRGRWIISQDVMNLAMEFDRLGKVPCVTYGNDGMPRIFGNQVEIEEYMPDLADDAASLPFALFGDLATYLVGLVGGIQLDASSDALFLRNQTALRGVINYDIVRKPVATLITVKTAAA